MPRSGRESEPQRSVGNRSAAPDAAPATAVGTSAAQAPWRPYLPALLVGALCIIAGGLVAAVTGPLSLAHGSWAAAYLVLVAGVAQIALPAGQAMLALWARHPADRHLLLVEFAGWNLGSAAVITGTLWNTTWLVNLGGVLLVVALAALLFATRSGAGRPAAPRVARGQRAALLAVRALVALLLVSIPVGLWLAYIRVH